MHFIQLTLASGVPIVVNVNHITDVIPRAASNSEDMVQWPVYINTDKNSIMVKETFSQVRAMIILATARTRGFYEYNTDSNHIKITKAIDEDVEVYEGAIIPRLEPIKEHSKAEQLSLGFDAFADLKTKKG